MVWSMPLLKALAVAPGLVVSTLLTCLVAAFLPSTASAALFVAVLAVAALLCAGRGEAVAVRLLWRVRAPNPAEAAALAPAITLLCRQGLGPPAVELYVRDHHPEVAAGGAGRRCVLISCGLVRALQQDQLPVQEAAAVIVHAVGRVRLGLTRCDAAIEFCTLPWRLVRAACSAVTQALSWLPLTRLAWKLRFVVAAVAVVQSVVEDRPVASGVVAVFIALTYLGPLSQRARQRHLVKAGDRFVVDHGHGPHLAAFLRRCPATTTTLERVYALAGPTAHPALAVVTAPTGH